MNLDNEHPRGWTAERADEGEAILDRMYAEAARLQAAAREATEGDER